MPKRKTRVDTIGGINTCDFEGPISDLLKMLSALETEKTNKGYWNITLHQDYYDDGTFDIKGTRYETEKEQALRLKRATQRKEREKKKREEDADKELRVLQRLVHKHSEAAGMFVDEEKKK